MLSLKEKKKLFSEMLSNCPQEENTIISRIYQNIHIIQKAGRGSQTTVIAIVPFLLLIRINVNKIIKV